MVGFFFLAHVSSMPNPVRPTSPGGQNINRVDLIGRRTCKARPGTAQRQPSHPNRRGRLRVKIIAILVLVASLMGAQDQKINLDHNAQRQAFDAKERESPHAPRDLRSRVAGVAGVWKFGYRYFCLSPITVATYASSGPQLAKSSLADWSGTSTSLGPPNTLTSDGGP